MVTIDRWRRRQWAPRWVFVASVWALSAGAQDRATADALFQAGSEAAERGDYAQACARFEASLSLEWAAGTVLNIADCRERQGQLAQAWQRYREVAERLAQGDARRGYASERATSLEARLPHLTLTLAEEAMGAQVSRNGEVLPAASLGVRLPVNPGHTEIVVRAEGREDRVFPLDLEEGDDQRLALTWGEPIAEAVEPAPVEPGSAGGGKLGGAAEPGDALAAPSRTWAYVGLGVGGVGLVAGGVTGALVLDRKSVVDDDCRGDVCRTEQGKQAAAEGRTLALISTAATAVGVVGVGVGLYFWLMGDDRDTQTARDSLRFEVMSLPGGAQVQWGGAL